MEIHFLLQIFRSKRFFVFDHFFGSAVTDHFSAFFPSFRTNIDKVVGYFNHIQIVFDYNNCITSVNQFVQDFKQYPYVFKVESGGRFVENVHGFPGIFFGQLRCQFYTL